MKRFSRRTLPVLFAVAMAGPARAADSMPDSLAPRTLEDYTRLARSANAALKAATYRAAAARERVGTAGSLSDPRLTYGYYVAHDDMQGRQELLVLQELPFFGKRGMRREVSSRDARAEAHNAHAAALDVDFEVKRAFYQYVGLSETARALTSETDLLRRMHEVAQVRYASGTSEQQDVLKIELALSRVADESTINAREIAATRARLNELTGRDVASTLPDPEWTVPDVSAIDAIALPDSALARRPEVAIAREEVGRAKASQRLAKREYWPDFMLGFKYEFGADEDAWWELMAGIDVPIWLGKRRAMVREADAMRQSAEYGLQAASLMTSREVEETAARARAARERYARFKDAILPQAEAAFESSEAGYRSGRVDFLDYLDSERMLLEFRKEYAMVIAELGVSFAELSRAVSAPTE
jgi:outer membrane protein TolC